MKKSKEVQYITPKLIIPDENQPRKYFDAEKLNKLSNSIEKHGIMNPLRVEPMGDKYLLIDGERRFRVAQDLKLKEVPVIITEKPLSDTERLIEQFNIQEQHEGWTAFEKARAVNQLRKQLNISAIEIAKLLNLAPRTVNEYVAIGQLHTSKEMEKEDISPKYAADILRMRNLASKLYREKLESTFTLADEKKFEKALFNKIRKGEIKQHKDMVLITDIMKTDPEKIIMIMDTDDDISEMYKLTSANAAYYYRYVTHQARYLRSQIAVGFKYQAFFKMFTPEDIKNLKVTHKNLTALLKELQ